MNPKVEDFISDAQQWQKEFIQLRSYVLECGLTEDFKWGNPCYTEQQKNIVLIHGFKHYCALLFFKGALLSDPKGLLIQQSENVQAGRQMRFTSLAEIIKNKTAIKNYIFEAIEVEQAGLKVEMKKKEELEFPDELLAYFSKNKELKTAFHALTPGRQRAYNLFFTAAKQAKTRESRIEASMKRIFMGKGPNDCICGLSKHYPNCDGSHKQLAQD